MADQEEKAPRSDTLSAAMAEKPASSTPNSPPSPVSPNTSDSISVDEEGHVAVDDPTLEKTLQGQAITPARVGGSNASCRVRR